MPAPAPLEAVEDCRRSNELLPGEAALEFEASAASAAAAPAAAAEEEDGNIGPQLLGRSSENCFGREMWKKEGKRNMQDVFRGRNVPTIT